MKKITRTLRVFSFCAAFILIAGVLCCALILEPSVKINDFERLQPQKLERSVHSPIITDSRGASANDTLVMSHKIYTPYADIPAQTINAFLAIEDRRFFQHNGVDYYRVAGAAVKNLKSGSFKEGASTITQQLVKNTHLTNEKSIRRKVNEIRIAADVERRYSKKEIMDMYLNFIYFGNDVYGLGSAARTYFHKESCQLSLNESAFLAGIINNPSKYNPVTNLENANQRRQLVLKQMLKHKFITKEEYEECVNSDISIEGVLFDQYANFLVSEACAALGVSPTEFLGSNVKVHTYLDAGLQQKVTSFLQSYHFKEKKNAIIHVLVMNGKGEILSDCSSSNSNLTACFRQPGSLIKPAICFAPAFEKKLIVPATPLLDEPTDFEGYAPRNYKDKNLGWISAAEALKQSQNIPAIKLLDMCGIAYGKSIAEKLGYSFAAEDNNLALALGGMNKGVLLSHSANAYQAFANGGEFIKCSHINKIVSAEGAVLYENPQTAVRAVSKETAYFINEILSECAEEGTAKRIGKGYAAKTGTVGSENGNSDAYAVAYTKNCIVAVWIGAKSGLLSNTVSGGTHPCIIAKSILDMLPPQRHSIFDTPDTVIKLDIDKTEYRKNHKIVLASKSAYPKDKISCSFTFDNVPKDRKLNNDYILDMDYMNNIDVKNFEIVDKFKTKSVKKA